jgi:hypothetical protein
LALEIHKTTGSTYGCLLLNQDHPLIQWLVQVKHACEQREYGLRPAQFETVLSLLDPVARYWGHEKKSLLRYLEQWKQIKNLPANYLPPAVDFPEERPDTRFLRP